MPEEIPVPVPVAIVSVPAEVTSVVPPDVKAAKAEPIQPQKILPSLPASTTFQQDLTLAGQRNINVMWEGTQKNIALMVVVAGLLVLGFLSVWPGIPTELRLVSTSTLSNILFAVISVYFTRTNHTKTGGVSMGETGR